MIPGDIPVIIIIDANIQEDIHNEGEIEEGEIEAIHFFSHPVLHGNFNAEKPERFYQQVQQNEQDQIWKEFLFQFDLLTIEHLGTDYQIYFLFHNKCNKFATDFFSNNCLSLANNEDSG